MYDATTLEKHETLIVEQVPGAPFPRKYVHSVFVDLQDAKQAAQALRAAHFDGQDIYVLESRDFAEAVSRGHSLLSFLTSTAYDMYLNEASQGRAFLAVRPRSYAQQKQIRDLLAPHHAYLVRYMDTWTMTELLP
jgi:hypothetical protein